MISKRRRSRSRSTRKRAKYSRSTAARKIQAQYRRRKSNRRGTLSVGGKMMTQRVGKWIQFAQDVDTYGAKQQELLGFDIKFPKAEASTDQTLLKMQFPNGIRQKNRIKLGGIRIQAIIETCGTVPIEMNYMVVQNTRPDPGQKWDALDKDFWIQNGASGDNSPDFLSQQVVWDPGMAFNKIRQDKFKILMHVKRTMMPQVHSSVSETRGTISLSGGGAGPVDLSTEGVSSLHSGNVVRIDRYLQMNKMMSFENPEDEHPYFPLHVLFWCTIRQPALFLESGGSQEMMCVTSRYTHFWNE